MIAQYHVYRLARQQGDIVVMDGNGLDELQAGLPTYEMEMVLERLLKLQVVDVAKELHCIARNYGRSYYNVLRSYLEAPLRRYLRKGRVLPSQPWLDERACAASDPDWVNGRTLESGRDPSLLNRMLYRETRHTNMPAVLMYSDRNSMAHSVEARFPYLDHRIVELCFSLPSSYKVGFGRRKRLLFETAKQYLPAPVIEGRKKMFVLMSNWMPLRGEHGRPYGTRRAARLWPASLTSTPPNCMPSSTITSLDGTITAMRCGAFTRRRAGWIFSSYERATAGAEDRAVLHRVPLQPGGPAGIGGAPARRRRRAVAAAAARAARFAREHVDDRGWRWKVDAQRPFPCLSGALAGEAGRCALDGGTNRAGTRPQSIPPERRGEPLHLRRFWRDLQP